jgi:hypothetical protein
MCIDIGARWLCSSLLDGVGNATTANDKLNPLRQLALAIHSQLITENPKLFHMIYDTWRGYTEQQYTIPTK